MLSLQIKSIKLSPLSVLSFTFNSFTFLSKPFTPLRVNIEEIANFVLADCFFYFIDYRLQIIYWFVIANVITTTMNNNNISLLSNWRYYKTFNISSVTSSMISYNHIIVFWYSPWFQSVQMAISYYFYFGNFTSSIIILLNYMLAFCSLVIVLLIALSSWSLTFLLYSFIGFCDTNNLLLSDLISTCSLISCLFGKNLRNLWWNFFWTICNTHPPFFALIWTFFPHTNMTPTLSPPPINTPPPPPPIPCNSIPSPQNKRGIININVVKINQTIEQTSSKTEYDTPWARRYKDRASCLSGDVGYGFKFVGWRISWSHKVFKIISKVAYCMWNTHLVLELIISFLAVKIVPVMLPCFTIFIRSTNFTRWFVFQHTSQCRYLFQLRVNLSPLRSHKSCHNFADTPEFCECNQGVECTRHLLFECPRYATHRATLAVSVIDILQRNNLNHLPPRESTWIILIRPPIP